MYDVIKAHLISWVSKPVSAQDSCSKWWSNTPGATHLGTGQR